MRRIAALSLIAFGLLAAPAHAKVRCTSGGTIMADGPLRVFELPLQTRLEVGWTDWACLGRHGKPVQVSRDVDAGEGGVDTSEYAFAGGRYLAVASIDDGANGGDGSYAVWDLRTRRVVRSVGAAWDFDHFPDLRLSPHGDIVAVEEENLLEVIPLHGRRQTLSHDAHDLALAGTTAYWTEGGVARSAALPGAASTAPDHHLARWYFKPESVCERTPGTSLLRTGLVRVARHGGRLFACRLRHRPVLALPSHLVAATLHAAHDRWLSGVDTCSHAAFVFDLGSGRTVTELPSFKARWSTTLLNDGTLAWIDDAGTLFAQPPDTPDAVPLATGASALASSGKTVYWTEAGAAHSWTAPPPANMPSASDFAGCA
jgi:hypothetical protein